MKNRVVLLFTLLATYWGAEARPDESESLDRETYQKVLDDLLVQTQTFQRNSGQLDPEILFETSGKNAAAAFYQNRVVFSLMRDFKIESSDEDPFKSSASYLNWGLEFVGANAAGIDGSDPVNRNVHYFGHNAPESGNHLVEYQSISYRKLYPGIDLKFYGAGERTSLKYDFIVQQDGNVDDIRMQYSGVQTVKLCDDGSLSLLTDWGTMKEAAPYSYQIIDGIEVEVDVRYHVEDNEVGFKVYGDYDKTKPLVIDPIYVDWSTYFYGDPITGSWGWNYVLDVDIDDQDYVYITGMTNNQRFYSKLTGFDTTVSGGYDAYVCKITPKGDSLEYFTYLGGSSYEYGMNVSVNNKYEIVVSGITWGGGFPVTSGAFDEDGKSCAGGWCYQGFVTKLNSKGDKLIFSTFLTGTRTTGTYSIDWIRGMKVANDGKVYLVGNTSSEDFPVTSGCYQSAYGGTKTTTGWNYWLAGDAFVTCLKADGTDLVFSTYLGGNGLDVAKDIYVDGKGDFYVVGQTSSSNFRTTPGANVFNRFIKGNTDAFVVKFKPSGSQIHWAKLMGGSSDDYFESIYATETGDPFIAGASNSSDFFTTKDAYMKSAQGGYDAVVVKMISAGTNVHYSTYLGGSGDDGYSWNYPFFSPLSITANVKDEAIIAVTSKSANFPTTSDAIQKTSGLSIGGFYGTLTITKLDFEGEKQLYGTFYGGSRGEFPGGVRAKKVGCVTYILSAGNSFSGDYPTTDGVYRDSLRATGSYWTGFVTKFRDTLYTEPIDLGFKDSIIECDNVFEIFDAKNQGADFVWNDGHDNRFHIVKDSGLVWVQATYGCDTVRDSIQILLEHSPKIPVLPNDTTYCDNFPTLQLDAKNDTIYRSYRWQNGDTSQRTWINQPGKYYVDIITPNCGTKTDTVNYKLLNTPDIQFTSDTIVCDSVSVQLDAKHALDEAVFNWSTGDSIQQIVTRDTGYVGVRVTNFCGTDTTDMQITLHTTPTVQLTPDSVHCNQVGQSFKVGKQDNGEFYYWDDIENTVGIGTSDSINFTSPVYARIIIENTCGSARDSIRITEIYTPVGGGFDTIYACDAVNEDLVLKTAKLANEELYSWSIAGEFDTMINVNQAGYYVGYLTNKCGTDSTEFEIILKETPTVNLPEDSIYCDAVSNTFDASHADPEMEYLWQDGSDGNTLVISSAGTYKVVLSNRCGTATDSTVVSMLETPTVDLGEDMVFCGVFVPQTYSVGKSDNGEAYLWSNSSTGTETTFANAGNHWVQITNKCATASDSVNFRVSQIPVVDLGPDTILCGDFSLKLDAGNPGMTYNWLPTGETTQVIQATEQVTYVVTVTNADGCEFSDDFRIGTECISYYHIPSAFSPNGDNLNDVFKPTLKNYQDYSMVIYNRWGEELYRSENPDIGWDGTYEGKEVSNGVYMYSIRFITTENGQFQTVKGLVNVLR